MRVRRPPTEQETELTEMMRIEVLADFHVPVRLRIEHIRAPARIPSGGDAVTV